MTREAMIRDLNLLTKYERLAEIAQLDSEKAWKKYYTSRDERDEKNAEEREQAFLTYSDQVYLAYSNLRVALELTHDSVEAAAMLAPENRTNLINCI